MPRPICVDCGIREVSSRVEGAVVCDDCAFKAIFLEIQRLDEDFQLCPKCSCVMSFDNKTLLYYCIKCGHKL